MNYLDRIRLHTSDISGLMFDDVRSAEIMAYSSLNHRVSPRFDDEDVDGDEGDRLLVDGFTVRKAPRRLSRKAVRRPKMSDVRMIPLLAVRNLFPTRQQRTAEKNGNG